MNRRTAWLIAILAALFITATLGQRFSLQFETGAKSPSVVQILPFSLVLLAGAAIVGSHGRILAPLRSRNALIWLPYLSFGILLPLVGVVTGAYPVRGVAAIRTPIFMASALVLGLELGLRTGSLRLWGPFLLVAGLAVAGYALLTQLLVGHILPVGPWYDLIKWDIATQQTFGGSLVFGRSSAFYINPNILGVWAAVSLILGLVVLSGRYRYLLVGLSLAALVLSVSRGPAIALGTALAFLFVLAYRRGRAPSLRSLLPYAGVAAVVIAGWALLSFAQAPVSSLPARVESGVGVLAGGSDASVTGRLAFWGGALDVLRSHPFGTLGPPQTFLSTAVDSDWVLVLVQGSVPYLVATALALFGGAILRGSDTPEMWALRAASVVIIVAGLAETPLEYPPIFLYWALVGWTLAAASRKGVATERRGV